MSTLSFVSLGTDDYDRAKRVLNAARHPGFVGRELFFRCATRGTCTIAVMGGSDVGVALVSNDKLQAMSVIRAAQGGGVGGALLAHVKPRWVNAIIERVPWFEKRGYRTVGGPRASQRGSTATQLLELVGEIPAVEATEPKPTAEELPDEAPALHDLLHEFPRDRAEGELMVINRLLKSAEAGGDYKACIALLEESRKIWQRHGTREE